MPISIVIGGQFGSEGKGKVAHYFTEKNADIRFVVRCGGSNSGHTVIDKKGQRRIFQQLPTAAILPDVDLAICSGSYIDVDILFKEIQEINMNQSRLFIDQDAVIITKEMKNREANGQLIESIGSTGSGTGAVVAARVNREKTLLFAKDIPELQPYITDVSKILRNSLSKDQRILIEGTQGFGLSPLHGQFYPFVTSRDTTAAAFLSETGLSPLDVDDIILTIRAFPIRVAGNSGPLKNEINWETVSKDAGYKNIMEERTSVTKKIRRVAKFNSDIVCRAIQVNKPTKIVLNHLDYLCNPKNSDFIYKFISNIENNINQKIRYLGFGPKNITDNTFSKGENGKI